MSNYNKQRKWADTFHSQVMSELKIIFRTEQVCVSSHEQDTRQACDYVVNKKTHIGARLRKDYYRQKYPNDFTIRTRTRHGGEPELSKILRGCGDYLFYGFTGNRGFNIYSYKLICLEQFRYEHEFDDGYIKERIANPMKNHDGTQLAAFNLNRMSDKMVKRSVCLHDEKREPMFNGWGDAFTIFNHDRITN